MIFSAFGVRPEYQHRVLIYGVLGAIVMRAKTEITEDKGGAVKIIVSEIPYQVNKAELMEKI